jgi:hypothetical protein
MVTPANVPSVSGQQALRDMVELEMYLLAQPQRVPWTLFPRRNSRLQPARKPHLNLVESDAAKELLDQGFIEATSNRTYVVSGLGYEFYEHSLRPISA